MVAGLAAVLFLGGCNFVGEAQEEAPEETVEETTTEETTETTVEEEDEETVMVEVEQPWPDLELDTPQPEPQSAPAAANDSPKQPTSLCHQDRSQCDEALPGIQTEREMEEMWGSQQAQRPQPPAYTPEEQSENRRSWPNGRQTGTVLVHRRGFRARWTTQPDEPHREEGSGRETTAGTTG